MEDHQDKHTTNLHHSTASHPWLQLLVFRSSQVHIAKKVVTIQIINEYQHYDVGTTWFQCIMLLLVQMYGSMLYHCCALLSYSWVVCHFHPLEYGLAYQMVNSSAKVTMSCTLLNYIVSRFTGHIYSIICIHVLVYNTNWVFTRDLRAR